jgi:GNAT superfamily N-acetyltransferase
MKSYEKYLKELFDDVEYLFYDEIDHRMSEEAYRMAKQFGISVLSDKDIFCIAIINSQVAGAIWTAWNYNEFSFDIVVSKKFQGRGLGKKLVDITLDEYNDSKEAYDSGEGTIIRADVVNQEKMKPLLLGKGFDIENEVHGHTIMTKK